MDMLSDREQLAAALGRPSIGVGDYYPVCSGEGYRGAETIEKSFGCYFPSEIHRVSERTIATYAMAKFGGDSLTVGGVPVSGNIGVRLIWTRDDTVGATTLPVPFTPTGLLCEEGTDPGPPPRPTASSGCVVTQQEIDFGNGAPRSEEHTPEITSLMRT